MEDIHRGVLGRVYVEEPRHSRADIWGEMDPAAAGTHGGRRWELRSASRPAFMLSKAAAAAVWEDLKHIRPPMYDDDDD